MASDLTASLQFGAMPAGARAQLDAARPPILRSDLKLFPAEAESDGSAAFVIYDPVSARYFRVSAEIADLIPLLDGRSAAALAVQAERSLGHQISPEAVEDFFRFLRANDLVHVDEDQRKRHSERRAFRTPFLSGLAKKYISFRIPLFLPDRFLTRTFRHVAWLGRRPMLAVHILVALIGLYLASRQVDVFISTFVGFLSLEGLAAYAVAVTIVKILHELGHAYTAKSYGVRIPVIGIAFIVFWPILYTDTTHAWSLQDRRQRLAIDSAGIAVELVVAAWSLLLWTLFPTGPAGAILFLLATSTWTISVLINLNPLMRFDGYYLFTDYLSERNLESRANAMGRWWLREMMLGLGDAPPERPRAFLVLFAFSVWVYRFFLFLGIALLVYHLFFRAAGIVLFLVEIYYFIARPILNEWYAWWSFRERLSVNFSVLRTVLILAVLGFAALYPWQGSVSAPAVIDLPYTQIYAPAAGRVESVAVASGTVVDAGGSVVTIRSAALDHQIAIAKMQLDETAWERAAIGVDPLRQRRALAVTSRLATQERIVLSKTREVENLTIKAPVTGTIVDFNENVRPGGSVEAAEPLFAIVEEDPRIDAYIDEISLARVEPGAEAFFYDENGLRAPIALRVSAIDRTGVNNLEEPYLIAVAGGPIETTEQPDKSQLPARAIYHLVLTPQALVKVQYASRGTVAITARPESLFAKARRRVIAILHRESDF